MRNDSQHEPAFNVSVIEFGVPQGEKNHCFSMSLVISREDVLGDPVAENLALCNALCFLLFRDFRPKVPIKSNQKKVKRHPQESYASKQTLTTSIPEMGSRRRACQTSSRSLVGSHQRCDSCHSTSARSQTDNFSSKTLLAGKETHVLEVFRNRFSFGFDWRGFFPQLGQTDLGMFNTKDLLHGCQKILVHPLLAVYLVR